MAWARGLAAGIGDRCRARSRLLPRSPGSGPDRALRSELPRQRVRGWPSRRRTSRGTYRARGRTPSVGATSRREGQTAWFTTPALMVEKAGQAGPRRWLPKRDPEELPRAKWRPATGGSGVPPDSGHFRNGGGAAGALKSGLGRRSRWPWARGAGHGEGPCSSGCAVLTCAGVSLEARPWSLVGSRY